MYYDVCAVTDIYSRCIVGAPRGPPRLALATEMIKGFVVLLWPPKVASPAVSQVRSASQAPTLVMTSTSYRAKGNKSDPQGTQDADCGPREQGQPHRYSIRKQEP